MRHGADLAFEAVEQRFRQLSCRVEQFSTQLVLAGRAKDITTRKTRGAPIAIENLTARFIFSDGSHREENAMDGGLAL